VNEETAPLHSQESPRDPPASALLGLLPHFLDTLRREPALAISITYLLVAMAGIFYDVSFYRKFDIPVLSLAQLGDFLTAGIQQPIALVLVASTFPLCWGFDRINMRYRRRQRIELARLRALDAPSPYERLRLRYIEWRVGQLWYTRISYLAVVVAYGWMFVGFYADYRAAEAKQGDAAEVVVWLNGEGDQPVAAPRHAWIYLGAISNYVFVYDREASRSAILPVNAIARIEPIPAPPSKTGVTVAPIP
jgi:hypothetical protein